MKVGDAIEVWCEELKRWVPGVISYGPQAHPAGKLYAGYRCDTPLGGDRTFTGGGGLVYENWRPCEAMPAQPKVRLVKGPNGSLVTEPV